MREHGREYLNRYGPLPPVKRYALECLAHCRTARLGGHRWKCNGCGKVEQSYNSCGNRHCNKCQAGKRAQWLAARTDDLLPVEYFHVVFTLPQSIAALTLQNEKLLYGVLMSAAADTLKEVAADPRHLQAQIGVLAVLHTWGQNLHHHPHVHCVVPGGGLSQDGQRWIDCPSGFFLPVRVLSIVFRAKFLKHLKAAYEKGELTLAGSLASLRAPQEFAKLLSENYQRDWVVFAKPPFGGPEQVLKYLARYTHRVAISNRRLVSITDGEVSFRWKNYAKGNDLRTMKLSAIEFIRRLMLHVLPKGFVRIRQYGLLANRQRKHRLARCRELLDVQDNSSDETQLNEANFVEPPFTIEDKRPCSHCRSGYLERIDHFSPYRWYVAYHDTS